VSSNYSTLSSLSDDIPLSDGEILQAWAQLCAFEMGGKAFRPTAGILLSLWKAMVAAAVAENIDLGSAFLADDLWALIREEGYPRGMFNVLLQRIAEQETMEVDSSSKCTRQIPKYWRQQLRKHRAHSGQAAGLYMGCVCDPRNGDSRRSNLFGSQTPRTVARQFI
jgi:hypothetical protein